MKSPDRQIPFICNVENTIYILNAVLLLKISVDTTKDIIFIRCRTVTPDEKHFIKLLRRNLLVNLV